MASSAPGIFFLLRGGVGLGVDPGNAFQAPNSFNLWPRGITNGIRILRWAKGGKEDLPPLGQPWAEVLLFGSVFCKR